MFCGGDLIYLFHSCLPRTVNMFCYFVLAFLLGNLWQDPPHYWEQIVHPAYVGAHSELFEDGDVENGKASGQKVRNLELIESLEMGTSDLVEKCCKILVEHAKRY